MNEGQTDPRVKFLSRGSGYTLFLTGEEAVLALKGGMADPVSLSFPRGGLFDGSGFERLEVGAPFSGVFIPGFFEKTPSAVRDPLPSSHVIRMNLAGSNPHPRVEGLDPLPGTSNYFISNDPSKWRTNVRRYAKVKLADVYPGIDMVYYGNQSQLEYDFVVKPGADPKAIQLAYEGVDESEVVKGDLVLKAALGDVVFKAPVVYQVKDGGWGKLEGRYALAGNNKVGFTVPDYDPAETMMIDPVLDYSTLETVGKPTLSGTDRLDGL